MFYNLAKLCFGGWWYGAAAFHTAHLIPLTFHIPPSKGNQNSALRCNYVAIVQGKDRHHLSTTIETAAPLRMTEALVVDIYIRIYTIKRSWRRGVGNFESRAIVEG